MVKQYIWVAIATGVFFAGLGVGYAMFTQPGLPMTSQQMQQMMSNPQMMSQWHQTIMNNPQAFNSWMDIMMNNPQHMNQMMEKMMNNPQFGKWVIGPMMSNPQLMSRWMGKMMQDPDFQQQYMGPWMMMRDPQFMQNMRGQWFQQSDLEKFAVQRDRVSILADTWQYQSTKAFAPDVIKVAKDTTVVWTNDDTIIHDVTDLGNSFYSGLIQPGEMWSHKFDSKGNYYYFCSIHPWMRGTVMVS